MKSRKRRLTQLDGPRRGYVIFTMAALLIVICGFAGLVFDVGHAEFIRRQAQSAADAGAKAAALQIARGETSTISLAAFQDTANNGFKDGVSKVTVTVNRPPLSGRYAGNNNFAEVIVSKVIPTTFMGVLGFSQMTVRARGVGGKGGSGGCVYVMDPTKSGALTVSGSGSLKAGCGVHINSNSSKALSVSGGACVKASTIQIVGNYSNSSSCALEPTPTTGVEPANDPLADRQPPSFGGCNYTNAKPASGSTLLPGVYCNGIVVSGGGTVNFTPGNYILLGGGLTVSGGSSITGTGVSFYNTNNSTYSYKPIVISGGSATNLSAPTSGPMEGILFFQDRSVVSTSANTVSGASGAGFSGAMYFLNSPLVYSGGSNSAGGLYTIIVADTLTISGPSYINDNYSSLSNGSPVKNLGILAE